MLTRISVVTGVLIAAVNLAVLFSLISWSGEQVAGVTSFVTLVGGAVYSWFHPNVPVGNTTKEG